MAWWSRSRSLRECALCVAVPLTPPAWAAAAARGESSSFAAHTGRWEDHESLAMLGLATVADARRAGVSVTTDATLEAWSRTLTQFEVVTLIAHWRSSRFQAADVRRWGALLETALDQTSTLRQALCDLDGAAREPEGHDVQSLVDWLNGVPARDSESIEAENADAHLVDEEYRIYRRRRVIEQAVPGLLNGGPAVEFGDGFNTVPQIVDRVDASIGGAVDLTVCNSVLLGEEIRRKCRDCLVMVNPQPASLAFRLALYRQVIALMRDGGGSYPDTTMRLRQYLRDVAGATDST